MRLDDYLIANNFAATKEKAQFLIIAGYVLVNNDKITKCGYPIKKQVDITILKKFAPYVSRGGEKLAGAHKEWQFPIKDQVALDIGISTGGFTDYLLQNEAKAVFGIDVSYGLLDLKIRNQNNVFLLERTNARSLTKDQLNKKHATFSTQISLVVMDVSFISITKILPTIRPLVLPDTNFIILVKPQFEAEKHQIEKGGVIKDKQIQLSILASVKAKLSEHFKFISECASPIKGTKGNQEYFFWLKNK